MGRLAAEVRRFARAHGLTATPGVVAVSGGADSVALLRALLEAGCGPLAVAHLNHTLRGEASDADEAFVRELASQHGCVCEVRRQDVAALAAGANLEATARRLRYEWFADVAARTGAAWVATGHTADDQAETVLHRLLRGTGLRGLRGIAASSLSLDPSSFILLHRPLLTSTRADVLAYLAALGQPFRDDASNADPRFTRNRVRHELLPLMRTFNPDAAAALGSLAGQASEAFDVIEVVAAKLLADAERPRAGPVVVLDAATLAAAPPLLTREALRLLWEREGWPMGRMTAAHWHRVAAVAGDDGGAAEFPDGVTARRAGAVVQVRCGA